MFNYCPSCGSKNISFERKKLLTCKDCGFHYYHNTATAVGCVINAPENNIGIEFDTKPRIIFMIRAKEPAIGKLDLPGGFIEPGEGLLEGLYRELKEEIGWTPQIHPDTRLSNVFTLLAAFPNVYPYKGVDYNTCDVYFSVNAPGLSEKDLKLEDDEIAGARILAFDEIDEREIAFESTKKAVKAYKSFFSSMYTFGDAKKISNFYSRL